MAPKIIYVAGFRQHAGKTTASIGLISALLKYFKPEEIGYIKPVGQEMATLANGKKIDKDGKLIQKFCLPDLDMEHVSPVKIASGVTKAYLSSDDKGKITQDYINEIKTAIEGLSDKKVIIAEGTGHPGVGSIVGLSNADVCKLIGANIIYLAGGGLGKSLDMLSADLSYFACKGVPVSGIVFNKLIPNKVDSMKSLITDKLLNEMYSEFNQELNIFGFLPEIQFLNKPSMHLIMDKFKESIPVGDPNSEAWTRPLNKFRIISLPHNLFAPEEHLYPNDVAIVHAASLRRLNKIIKHNKSLPEKLAGIILTCSKKSEVIQSSIKILEQSHIPALFVQEDTATTSIKLENCIENTKLQTYDETKIQNIFDLFQNHFDIEKFISTYKLLD